MILNNTLLRELLSPLDVKILCFDSIASTNTALILMAKNGEKPPVLVITAEQTAGRGQRGHKFQSPDTGVYFSLLMPLPGDLYALTPRAAVACADAIDEMFAVKTRVKAPNDLFLADKKVGGILTEAFADFVVAGIGLNVYENTFPGLPNAGFITKTVIPNTREKLAALVVTKLFTYNDELVREKYRAALINKEDFA